MTMDALLSPRAVEAHVVAVLVVYTYRTYGHYRVVAVVGCGRRPSFLTSAAPAFHQRTVAHLISPR